MRTLPSDMELLDRTEAQALALLVAAQADTSAAERAQSKRLAHLLDEPKGRDLLLDLTDQVMRIRSPRRAARRLRDVTRSRLPKSLGFFDRFGLKLLGTIAPRVPTLAARAVNWRVDRDTEGVILRAEDADLRAYIQRRQADGFRLNINVLGEAILGDDEASERYRKVLAQIRRPDVDYVSVKISAICANLDVLAEEDSLRRIAENMRPLYRAAKEHAAFVNMDMEEFRDLELSLRTFMDILSEPEFVDLPAGVVLQAYLPDSHEAADRLCAWANARVAAGGAPIKIRLVKGANLVMEQVEAEMHDWPQAPYPSKVEVDASYKHLLERILTSGEPNAVRIGIASHNLFEISWALSLRDAIGAQERIDIEMLEGMAPPQARAVRAAAGGLLLYAPVVEDADRDASIAYLSRRLDENSSPENFLKSLFDIAPGSAAHLREMERFRASVPLRKEISTSSRRRQDRSQPAEPSATDGTFANCVDTDFTSRANREWVQRALTETPLPQWQLLDTIDGVDGLVATAHRAQQQWAHSTWDQRRILLARIADVMEEHRGQTLAIMSHTTEKTIAEGDPEISEAIDFARYAAHLTLQHEQIEAGNQTWHPHAVVVVAGPWNFPYAIPANGLVHAIAAGSAVIMKPAPEARAVAAALVDHLVEAGVPGGLVQLACTPDDQVGRHLITHPDVDMVMLTGSYTTADHFVDWKPDINLLAETSGKNALIITAAADIDQAVKDLVRSAFGHAGQKCSAASLAIVEAEVYDDPNFHRRLADAVRSLRVGVATDPATRIAPVITPPVGPLERALTQLEAGESWLVEPALLDDTGRMWAPGVRIDVQPGSWFHRTECFGPVLGIMRADDLDHAIILQNATEYGLTGGIHSLDPQEIAYWLEHVQVGNAYINRHITGAIVQRQPFGGWKRSTIGVGRKPGGPGHLHSYGTWVPNASPSVQEGQQSYANAWQTIYRRSHDPSGLRVERNILRYRSLPMVIVRHDESLTPQERALIEFAATTARVPLTWSDAASESDEQLSKRLINVQQGTRIRLLSRASDALLLAAHRAGIAIDRAPVTEEGIVEMGHWVREQAISQTMHRYGRLIQTEPSSVNVAMSSGTSAAQASSVSRGTMRNAAS